MPTYDVEYAISRCETYRVVAKSRKEAEELAFCNGEMVDTGETNSCEVMEVKKVKL